MAVVTAITSFGRSGTYDWLMQRCSAVVLLAYSLFLCIFLLQHPELRYVEWRALHEITAMRLFSSLALLAFVVHAWIGLWSVTTDYLTARALGPRAIWLRLPVQLAVLLAIFLYLGLGFAVIWR